MKKICCINYKLLLIEHFHNVGIGISFLIFKLLSTGISEYKYMYIKINIV